MHLVLLFSLLTLLLISRCRRKDLEQRPRSWKRTAAHDVQKYASATVLRARSVNAAKIFSICHGENFSCILSCLEHRGSPRGARVISFAQNYILGFPNGGTGARQRHGRSSGQRVNLQRKAPAPADNFFSQTAKKINQTEVKNARDDGQRL